MTAARLARPVNPRGGRRAIEVSVDEELTAASARDPRVATADGVGYRNRTKACRL